MSFIESLRLHHFRSYEQARLENLPPGFVVLYGANGAGKTNILEAVSLLSPGRGLRGARMRDIQRNEEPSENWAVSALIKDAHGIEVRLGTGAAAQSEKRVIRINGETAKNQAALADYLACVWLTPQMDRLFLESSRERRKFLDRLVFAFDPGHSGRSTRYENAMRQRSKLLSEGKGEPAWLASLESQMAETGTAIAAARLEFTNRLQAACKNAAQDHFPRAELTVKGTLESLLETMPALEVEDFFKNRLADSRGVDMLTGGAAVGPHKSDLDVLYAAKNMQADQCSTGEQKALLIGIVLAHARLITAERGHPPVLLLDEVAAHLDEKRRAALYEALEKLGGQVWLTGTDYSLFEAAQSKGSFFEIRDGEAVRNP
ncbi:MAG: DNA replication/repair protein RecF [Alphaproteobacteria bacterium]|nr:DNA replication/repair protein RecF [Alphaproteobacteria bacterium]